MDISYLVPLEHNEDDSNSFSGVPLFTPNGIFTSWFVGFLDEKVFYKVNPIDPSYSSKLNKYLQKLSENRNTKRIVDYVNELGFPLPLILFIQYDISENKECSFDIKEKDGFYIFKFFLYKSNNKCNFLKSFLESFIGENNKNKVQDFLNYLSETAFGELEKVFKDGKGFYAIHFFPGIIAKTLKSSLSQVGFLREDSEKELDYFLKYNFFALYEMVKISNSFLWDKIFESQIKSAISTVMARNMSHNIGSHVLSEIVSEGIVESEPMEMAFYRYLQHRMDFIAQITTEIPRWSYSAWFFQELMKEFYNQFVLLDRIGISEGLRAYEWENEASKKERMGKIIIRTGIKYKDKEKIEWKISEEFVKSDIQDKVLSNDVQVSVPGGHIGFHSFYTIIEGFLRNDAKHSYHKYCKRLSSGDLYCYANNNEIKLDNGSQVECENVEEVYFKEGEQIIKKFILTDNSGNSKKNNGNDTECLYLTLYESEKVKRYIKFEDFEGLKNYLSFPPLRINIKIEEVNGKNYYWLTIWSDIVKGNGGKDEQKENIFDSLNKKLGEPLIDKKGVTKKMNWGLQEIKISAGFLQMRDIKEIGMEGEVNITNIEKIEELGYPKGILKYLPVNSDGKEFNENDSGSYFLGLKFWVRKPKELLCVTGDDNGK